MSFEVVKLDWSNFGTVRAFRMVFQEASSCHAARREHGAFGV